jgi:hypothetical protein
MAVAKSGPHSATKGVAVSLASDTVFTTATRGPLLGTAGNVVVAFLQAPGTYVTLYSLAAGIVHPLEVTTIRSTANGTTGSDITAVF